MSTNNNIVFAFNLTRAKTEGNLAEAYKQANALALPKKVVQYIALTTQWRDYEDAFRLLCQDMADDASLPIFWRAAVLESLGATSPAGQEATRLQYFDRAEALVKDMDAQSPERLYIDTCVVAGRNETAGQHRSLDVFQRVAEIMVDHGWFNAPGRLKAWCDELVKVGRADEARPLVAAFAAKQREENAFSPRQTGFLTQAHGALFPS